VNLDRLSDKALMLADGIKASWAAALDCTRAPEIELTEDPLIVGYDKEDEPDLLVERTVSLCFTVKINCPDCINWRELEWVAHKSLREYERMAPIPDLGHIHWARLHDGVGGIYEGREMRVTLSLHHLTTQEDADHWRMDKLHLLAAEVVTGFMDEDGNVIGNEDEWTNELTEEQAEEADALAARWYDEGKTLPENLAHWG
jgi:hypothetical protein